MKKLFSAFACIAIAASVASAAPAKASAKKSSGNGEGKIGLGYTASLATSNLPNVNLTLGNVAFRYWSPGSMGFEGLFGFNQGDDIKLTNFGGKILAKIEEKPNVCLYGFGIVEICSYSVKSADISDTETVIGGGVGAELTIPGIPNLTFLTEMGLLNANKAKVTRTFGEWIPTAGVRYYW
ncbi:MAG: hypothetical protein JW803_02650 [Endomicrobiales bacterium]|nr:hypothetical protein [Endomicrobiales bacterium]